MPTANLKAQLKTLVELQNIDAQIYSLEGEKAAKPKEAEALQVALEEKNKSLASLEGKSLDLQKQRKDNELELASKEGEIKKLQTQLYQLKTNKEYQAMLQQIEEVKVASSLIEDKILQLFEQADKLKNEIEGEKQRLKEEEKVTLEAKKKIEERIKEIDERLAQLAAQRDRITPGIDKNIFSQYERILHSRDWLAIVEVKDNACAGCNMFVPPQVINLIRMYDRIVTCEVCNRILYIEEETP